MARPRGNGLNGYTTTANPTFDALAELPQSVRQEICFAYRVWDAIVVRDIYRNTAQQRGAGYAADWLIASIQAADEQEAVSFGRAYLARYRIELPHLAAGATILRYQPPVGGRSMRLSRGAEPRVRAAWAASARLLPA